MILARNQKKKNGVQLSPAAIANIFHRALQGPSSRLARSEMPSPRAQRTLGRNTREVDDVISETVKKTKRLADRRSGSLRKKDRRLCIHIRTGPLITRSPPNRYLSLHSSQRSDEVSLEITIKSFPDALLHAPRRLPPAPARSPACGEPLSGPILTAIVGISSYFSLPHLCCFVFLCYSAFLNAAFLSLSRSTVSAIETRPAPFGEITE